MLLLLKVHVYKNKLKLVNVYPVYGLARVVLAGAVREEVDVVAFGVISCRLLPGEVPFKYLAL
jgi:hypothetical protein